MTADLVRVPTLRKTKDRRPVTKTKKNVTTKIQQQSGVLYGVLYFIYNIK